MRTLALLAALTVVAMAFAGCSDGGGDGDSSTTSSSASGTRSSTGSSTSRSGTSSSTGSATSTSTGSNPLNNAPTGSITVAVNGTNATFTLQGSDPDGDTIVWDLTFGDGNVTNGTSLPANVTHAYGSAGNFTANFTITDGSEPVTYDLVVPVSGAGASTGIVFTAEQTTPSNPVSSTVIPNVGFAGANACAGFTGGENGLDCVWFDLLPEYEGRMFTATTDAGDPDYEFWPACPFSEAAPDLAISGSTATGPESGEIPGGAGCIVLWAKSPPAVPVHTFTVL